MNRQSSNRTGLLRSREFIVSAAIVALIWIVFGQTLSHDFVNYDDKTYVYGNSLVSVGLNPHGLAQAFVDTQTTNWHPLTTLSHMLDCQIFGLKAGGHHFVNVLLHTVAALLLFSWLSSVTGKFWGTAFVAAVFAIHPLRVESVAWIAERKDVLSAVFFFLTLITYTRYAQSPSPRRYLAMAIMFACGLMSKPMLVTTPVILLLLDYWPLRRGHRSEVTGQKQKGWPNLVLEKIPLFALSFIASAIAIVLQIRAPASIDQLPLMWRLENAAVSYWIYFQQIFWPDNLTVFYPHPDNRLAFWQVGSAVAFLIGVTFIAFVVRKRYPYLLVGWLWYLIMLLPVIGIIEVGLQGHADRYTYLPQVGLYIALTWLIADFPTSIVSRRGVLGTAVAVVVALTACSWKQTTYWRNSDTLWRRALAVTENNDVALTNLGNACLDRGQLDEALLYLQRALTIRSASNERHYALSLAIIHDTMGNVLAAMDRVGEAIEHFRQAISLRPDLPDSHYNLGVVLLRKGDVTGAIGELRTTLTLRPNDAEANTSLANALIQKGLFSEAISHYQAALQTEPASTLVLNNLAWLFAAAPDASVRNGPAAVELALRLNELTKNNEPVFIRTLAAAYAEAGQFEKAVDTGKEASGLAHAQGQDKLAAKIEVEASLYRQRLPFRDQTLPNAQ